MKKFLLIISLFATLFFAQVCLAAPNINELTEGVASQGGYETRGVTDTTFSETVGKIIKIVLTMVGTIFLALTVYAGILWMTAGGAEEKVTKAKTILQTSVIGLIIVVAAYSITYFIVDWTIQSQNAPTWVGDGEDNAMTR